MADPTSSPRSSHDLKWEELVGHALASNPTLILRTPALTEVFLNFWQNVNRIHWMILATSMTSDLAMQVARCIAHAEWQITGQVNETLAGAEDHPEYGPIQEVAKSLYNSQSRNFRQTERGTQISIVMNAISRGTWPVKMMQLRGAPARAGFEAILFSCITSAWTAYESMAADLWESAINTHPQGLSELKGKPKRILRPDEIDDAPPSDIEEELQDKTDDKSIYLRDIIRRQFDLRNVMGSVLRPKCRFDHLAGIREAYALAFFKNNSRVDEALKSKALDAVSAIRNLIVHRSGNVDETYQKKCKYLDVPKADLRKPIQLDGEIVSKLLTSLTACSINLVVAVDLWISEN